MATTGIFVILCDWVRHYPEDLDFHRTESKLFLSQTEMDTFTTPRVISRSYVLKTVAVRLQNFVTVTDYHCICIISVRHKKN